MSDGQAISPAAGSWAGSRLEPRVSEDETLSPRERRMIARVDHGRALRELFRSEIILVGTTFPLAGGGHLGPVKLKDGSTLVWQGMWLPHRRAMFEEFKKKMPTDEEMAARDEFVKANDIAYAFSRPGFVFEIADVVEWLDKTAAHAA